MPISQVCASIIQVIIINMILEMYIRWSANQQMIKHIIQFHFTFHRKHLVEKGWVRFSAIIVKLNEWYHILCLMSLDLHYIEMQPRPKTHFCTLHKILISFQGTNSISAHKIFIIVDIRAIQLYWFFRNIHVDIREEHIKSKTPDILSLRF